MEELNQKDILISLSIPKDQSVDLNYYRSKLRSPLQHQQFDGITRMFIERGLLGKAFHRHFVEKLVKDLNGSYIVGRLEAEREMKAKQDD